MPDQIMWWLFGIVVPVAVSLGFVIGTRWAGRRRSARVIQALLPPRRWA